MKLCKGKRTNLCQGQQNDGQVPNSMASTIGGKTSLSAGDYRAQSASLNEVDQGQVGPRGYVRPGLPQSPAIVGQAVCG